MVYHKYVLIPSTTACYLTIAGYGFFFLGAYGSLPNAAIWWCLRTGGGGVLTRSAFSHQTDNNTATASAIPIFNARDALGRTPLESVRAYASSGQGAPRSSRRVLTPRYPPTRRKRRGRGFGGGTRWRAGRGPIGQLACACWSAPSPPPPTLLATMPHRRRRRRRVWGGVSLRSGRRTERDKKNVVALYGCLPVIETQQPTKNTRTQRRR
jgi:hypothetical protein